MIPKSQLHSKHRSFRTSGLEQEVKPEANAVVITVEYAPELGELRALQCLGGLPLGAIELELHRPVHAGAGVAVDGVVNDERATPRLNLLQCLNKRR